MKLNEKMIFFGAAALVIFSAAIFIYTRQNRRAKEAVNVKIDTIEDVKGLGYSGQRKIATDSHGNFFMAYRKKYQGKSEIFVAKAAYTDGQWKISGTSRPISQVASGVDQRVPSIAVDPKNNLHAVWYGSDMEKEPNNRQVKYSRSSDGGKNWTRWKNISFVAGYDSHEDYWQEHPHILSATDGKLFAVWEGKDQDNRTQQIKFSRSSDGGATWSQWINVQASQGNTQSRPTLVEDQAGGLHLFMYTSEGSEGGRQQIQYLRSDNAGNSWSERLAISDPGSDSRHVSAAADAQGTIHAAWRAQNSSGYSRIVYRSWKNGSWSEIRSVAPREQYQFFPSLGVDRNGKINIAWMESDQPSDLPTEDPQDGKVYLSRLISGAFSTPREISSQKSGLYPHIQEKFGEDEIPIIYESGIASDRFELVFNLIKWQN